MITFLQAHPQLSPFLIAAGLGVIGVLELLMLRSKGVAIATWAFAAFWLLAGLASIAGLGTIYNDYVAYLLFALVGLSAVIAIVNRVRA